MDEAIGIIQNSGIKYEVGPFATVLEGKYLEVMQVINEVNEFLYAKNKMDKRSMDVIKVLNFLFSLGYSS